MKTKQILVCFIALSSLLSACKKDETPVEKASLKVSPSTISATAEAGTYAINIESNVYWDLAVAEDCQEWLSASVTNGSGDAEVTISVTKNDPTVRTGKILVTSPNAEVEPVEVTVNQEAGEYIPQVSTIRVARWDYAGDQSNWPTKGVGSNDLELGLGVGNHVDTTGANITRYFAVSTDNIRTFSPESQQVGRFYSKGYLCFGSMWFGDYWLWEVNNSDLIAGDEVSISFTSYSSGTATHIYWALECSVDGGSNWTLMGEQNKTSLTNDVYTHMCVTGGSGTEVSGTAKLSAAPASGKLLIRFRVSSNQNKTDDGEVTATTTGNTQLRNEAVISATITR